MNDIVYTKSYEDYRLEVGTELLKTSESFVRIGYLLKVARDTEVLNGTEYEGNYMKFAEKEFGLEKTQVSRFIRINDKFSVNGNSPELQEQYQGFGTRKLGIMLTLPDEVVEELSPDYTVKDMEEIEAEVKEEQKISPLEQLADTIEAETFPTPASVRVEGNRLEGCIYQIFEDYPHVFKDVYDAEEGKKVKALAPIREQTYIIRIAGQGRQMVLFHEENIAIVNARTGEKEFFEYHILDTILKDILSQWEGLKAETAYKGLFEKEFPADDPVEEPKRVQNGVKKKDAKKNESKKAEATKREKADGGTKTKESKPALAAEQSEVHDIQPEGSTGEDSVPGDEDQRGIEAEPSSLGAGETLPGEDSGAAGGEGNTAGTPGRNKYTSRLENLTYSSSILAKDLAAGQENIEEALKEARMIKQCIEAIIQDLEAEEKPAWREIK